MAITTRTLTASIEDLLGQPINHPERVRVVVRTNMDPGQSPIDQETGALLLGTGVVKVAPNGALSISGLIDSAANTTDDVNPDPATLQYRVVIEYTDPGKLEVGRWDSGWFSVTADGLLGDVVAEQFVPPTWITTAIATLQTYVDAAEAAKADAETAGAGVHTDATAAANSATAAASSATAAAGSATAASTSAGNAATSATAAAGSATAAAGSASSASTSAGNAASSATAASTAATSAANAKTAAESARDAAQAAQTAAEAVGTTNDTVIAGRINDSASATRTALKPLLNQTRVRVADYGVKGDWTGGVGGSGTNDTAALQALADAVPDGTTLVFEKDRTYRFDNLAITGKVVHLDFNGASLVVKPWDGVASTAQPAIHVTGSTTTPRSIGAAAAGATTVTLSTAAQAADFAVGDFVVLSGEEVLTGWDGNRNQVGRREVNYVSSVNATTGVIGLSSPLEQPFTNTPKIAKINALLEPSLRGIRNIVQIDTGAWSTTNDDFGGVDTNTPHLINFRYCIRPRVENVSAVGWDMQVLVFSYCDQPYGQVAGRLPYRPTIGGHGYLARMVVCRNGLFDRLYSYGVRHTADYVMSIDCGSRNCVAIDTVISSYVAHGIQNFRAYSIDDVVIQSSTSAYGWGLGNPTFGADYGFTIIRPKFRGVGVVFKANYGSTDLAVLDADVVTDRRPFYCSVGVNRITVRGGSYRMTNPASTSFAAADGLFDMRQSETSAPFGTTITTTTANGDVTIENIDVYGATQHIAAETTGDFITRDIRWHSPSENYGGSTLVYLYTTAPRNLIVERHLIDGGNVRNHVRTLVTPTGRQEFVRNYSKATMANSIVGEITALTLIEDNRYTLADGTTAVEMSLTNANQLDARKRLGARVVGNFPGTYDGVKRTMQPGVYAPSRFHGLSTRTLATGSTYAARFTVDEPRSIGSVAFSVATAAGGNDAIDIAIYDADDGTKLASTGATSSLVNSTGRKVATLTTTAKLVPGKAYYVTLTTPSSFIGSAAILDAVASGGTSSVLATLFGSTMPYLEIGFVTAGGTAPTTLSLTGASGTAPLFALLDA